MDRLEVWCYDAPIVSLHRAAAGQPLSVVSRHHFVDTARAPPGPLLEDDHIERST